MKKIFTLCILATALLAGGISLDAKTTAKKKVVRKTMTKTTKKTPRQEMAPADSVMTAPEESELHFTETPSGLKYYVYREGTGISPTENDIVKVHYEGSLPDGTVFDSSYQRGEPIEFPLNRVIKGWTEGVQLMKEGAAYIFYIPYQLAYGENGTPGGPIGPKQDLIFFVELLEVKKK